MSAEITAGTIDGVKSENKSNDKEYNFRALETKYQRQLELERAEREKLARELEETRKTHQQKNIEEEDDDSEPYIDKRRLNKTISGLEKKFEDRIEKKAEEKARSLLAEKEKSDWLDNHEDFYPVLDHAEKFAQRNPRLAASILRMPDSFERQKLVYENIKAFGLDKPEQKQSSIQDKIDANRKTPYYQPTGVGAAPYAAASDFSAGGQKQAYDKMQELKSRLRLG